jgi:RNA-directed DNA polymerase
MSRLAGLKLTTNLSELATLLQFKPAALSFILFKQAEAKKYTTFEIPKRKGGKRTIKAPIDALKLVQRKLSDLLQDCVDEINKANNRKDRIAHGFKRDRSIITNARQHRHRRHVFNVDIEDFFPSINFGRVLGFFTKDRNFQLNKSVATVIAQIACHGNSLPQGSPCSPVISNLITHPLDMNLVALASTVGCTYSRYADDLTFSTNKKDFPKEIAVPSPTDPHRWLPGRELQRLIARGGFKVNASKTHMQYRTSRQEVTGLVVNRRIGVREEYRHNARAMVHSLIKKGVFEVYGLTPQGTIEKREGTVDELHGMLGFVDSIDVYNQKNTSEPKRDGLTSKELVYRQFLLYKDFYKASRPVIICEGSTDNVYLTHAIRGLAAEFPDLAEITPEGKKKLKVRLYKYPESSTARILGLGDGGSGVLSKFISLYNKETDKFTAPGLTNPVIVFYDNDSGAKGIRGAIGNAAKKKVVGTEPFVHVVKNMYAVATPISNPQDESKVEDFFDAATKRILVDGKTFNPDNKVETATEYGKVVFAHRVVKPRAETIDFSGFRPMLSNLSSAIREHAAALAGAAASAD